MVESENAEKGFQPFFEPDSMTWGARSFRRRGTYALRFPGDGACQKQAAERSMMRRSFAWRLRPVLLLERYLRKLRHRSGRRARSCSTSPLSPLSVERLRKKNGQKRPGKRKRRKASRGAPQTMPPDGTAPFKHGQRERPRVAHLGEKPSVVSKETSAMSEGGTAVRGVPVRQIQLQKSRIDG